MTFHPRITSILWAGLCTLVVLSGCTSNAYRALESTDRPVSSSASSRPAAVQSTPSSRPTTTGSRPDQYRVREGDTLYSIAFRYGLDYRRLAAANDIDQRFTIYPGQVLRLKEAATPVASPPPPRTKPSSTPQRPSGNNTPSKTATKPTQAPVKATSVPSVNNNNNQLSWVWPHDGKIVRTFNSSVSDRKGVDLTGEIGDSVVAAATGLVVYAGDGLPGYGNLIILEHSGSLLSAYAFNQELLVSEQDQVTKGQAIARMGRQGDQPSLHFEIRQEGKPVDPMRFLPPR